jgi:hypothetical protein
MLGRLSRWLRIIGYDTLYFSRIDDEEIVARARDENRILLTRDTLLIKRRAVTRYLFIESDYIRTQFRQVVHAYGLDTTHLFVRCLKCNSLISPVDKEEIHTLVPPYVFDTKKWFARCDNCGKVYWRGTHIEHVQHYLETA